MGTSRRGQDHQALAESVRRWLELPQELANVSNGLVAEALEPDALIEGYIQGREAIHLRVRLGAGASHEDAEEFCAFLQNDKVAAADPCDGAVHRNNVPAAHGIRTEPNGLHRAVLVSVGYVPDQREHTPMQILPSVVRLSPPDDCEICSTHARKLRRQGGVETTSCVMDGEVDTAAPAVAHRGGRRRTPLHEKPRELIETRPKVAHEVSETQAPAIRWRRDPRKSNDDGVALWVVLVRNAIWWWEVAILEGPVDISLQRVEVEFRPTELGPRALEARACALVAGGQ